MPPPQLRFTKTYHAGSGRMSVTEMKDHVYKILELVGSSEKYRGCHSKCHHPRIKDHSRDEMVRSRATEGPYRKWVCPTLPGDFASWIHAGGVVLTKRRSAVEFEPRVAAGTRKPRPREF